MAMFALSPLVLFREITPPAGFAVLSTELLLHALLHCTICTMSTLYTAQSVQCVHIVQCNMVHCCKTLCQEITPSANLYLPLIYPVLLCTVQLTAEIKPPMCSISHHCIAFHKCTIHNTVPLSVFLSPKFNGEDMLKGQTRMLDRETFRSTFSL